jgi:hypothetical protein
MAAQLIPMTVIEGAPTARSSRRPESASVREAGRSGAGRGGPDHSCADSLTALPWTAAPSPRRPALTAATHAPHTMTLHLLR